MKNAWRANWPHLLVLAALVALGACGTDGKSTPDVTDAAVLDHLPELEAGPVDASPVDQLDTRVEETLPELPDLAPEVEAVETVEETTPDVPPEIKPPCETGDDCEDGDYCTVDKCVGGECLHQEKNCNDGNKCTEDWCDPESGLCQHEPSDCEDGNPCTWDSCMPGTGCEHEEIPDCCPGTLKTEEGFEEGLSWTVVTEFQPEGNGATWQTSEGKAHGGDFSLYMGSMETLNYDFGGRVRVFAETLPLELSADVASELRFWTWMNLEASANYDTFTLFVVDEDGMTPVFGKEKGWLMKKWKAIQIDLKAYRGKTVKFRFVFDSIDGKDNDYEGIYIDDFQVWEMCPDQGCITKVECNDGLVCTEDKCVGGTCQYTFVESCCMNLGDCLDTDPCTIDACKENLCEPLVLSPPYCCYAPEDCEDDNVCTQDICDESGICLHPPSMAPGCCEVNADCDDGNPCTDNICNPDDSSCYFPFNSVGCDDGNKCTKNDHCIEGSCGGDPVVCSDGNNCTYDQCNPDTGCYYPNIPQGEACDDLNACTQNDVCLLGECGGEWVEGCCLKDSDCNDNDTCTIDKCTQNECQNINTCCFSDEECDDFDDVCTIDACVEGACVYTPTGVEGCCAQVIFRDDFSTDKGWEFGPEWERGTAEPSVPGSGNPDPADDHSSSDDDYIIGVNIGGNAVTTIHDFYWATSPEMDTTNATNLHLYFWRWLNSDYANYMVNAIDVYNGSTWKRIWETGGSPGIMDSSWQFLDYNVTQHKASNFRVRFGFKIGSGGVYTIGSWNVDDVTVVDKPGANAPGICCDQLSDCQGIYPNGTACSGGMCTTP